MKYYLHDSNAFNDEKITELFIKFGYEGLGLFYTALEKFAAQEKPIKTEVLKKQLGVGKRLNRCWLFMEEIGIISSSNGESFNKELLKFSEKYQIKKEKNAKRVADFRARQENVTHYVSVSNAPKVKLSKVNSNNTITSFKIPKLEEVEIYFINDLKSSKDKALRFFQFYGSKGWVVGKSPMKNWHLAAARSLSWGEEKTVKKDSFGKRNLVL